jgi:Haem-NO-binding
MRGLILRELLAFASGAPGEPPPGSADADLETWARRLAGSRGLPPGELLRSFGTHLFGRLADLAPVFVAGSDSALAFLADLERTVHDEVRKLHPELALPRLRCVRRSLDEIELVYESGRDLADLAEGLIAGCGQFFGEPLDVKREPSARGELFRVRRLVAQRSGAR